MLVFVQSDARGPFHAEIFAGLREVVDNDASGAVSIYLEYLDRRRFNSPAYQDELTHYLAGKYRDRPIGVIVSFGADTLEFIAPLRAEVWAGIPMVFGQVDESAYRRLPPQPNATGHTMRVELSEMVSMARSAVPDLKTVAIAGDDFKSQPVFRHFQDQIPEVAKSVNVIDLTGIPMTELQARVATLPDKSAILYTAIYSDGRGTFYPPVDALKFFSDNANRPIIVSIETFIGTGAVGGIVILPRPIGIAAATLALRILAGEDAASIPVTRANVVKPVFDWRQLGRWGIDESALPKGSEIRFKPAAKDALFYTQAAAIAAMVMVVGGVIVFWFREHGKRRQAEDASRQRISELAHVNRQATAGEMSAAIAHELNQPLGSILNNAEAAEIILGSAAPDLDALKGLLGDIRRSDKRASDIIKQLRALMSKNKDNFSHIDINEIACQAVEIGEIQAKANAVTLHLALAPRSFRVKGDSIQLQQVVLNLMLNGIEALNGGPPGRRDIVISTSRVVGNFVEVSVSDTGPGIPDENLHCIFEPFFSTKESGMGVGLSLCRTIVESHDGIISAANGFAGGAVFRIQLPLVAKGALS